MLHRATKSYESSGYFDAFIVALDITLANAHLLLLLLANCAVKICTPNLVAQYSIRLQVTQKFGNFRLVFSFLTCQKRRY